MFASIVRPGGPRNSSAAKAAMRRTSVRAMV